MSRLSFGAQSAIIFLLIVHLSGLYFLVTKVADSFLINQFGIRSFAALTPFPLLLNAYFIFRFQRHLNWYFIFYAILVFVLSFAVEAIGVATGYPFGYYIYGPAFGPKLFDTPLLIGLNWFVLLTAASSISNKLFIRTLPRMIGTASLMTVLDIFIEPIAIHLNYWQWRGMIPPVSNYLGWFGLSFVLSYFFVKGRFRKHNPIAPFIFYIQFGFFVVFNLLIH